MTKKRETAEQRERRVERVSQQIDEYMREHGIRIYAVLEPTSVKRPRLNPG